MLFSEWIVGAGFIAGFVGSLHCVAMCGGLVGVVSAAMKTSARRAVVYWSGYHAGRIISYTIAGVIVGGIGSQVSGLFPMHRAHVIGAMIAGVFLIILGGHVAGWWHLLVKLEAAGGRVWQKIVPKLTKVLPPRMYRHAIIGGLLWGWLPCGLVYSTLVLAATAADPIGGGLTMAAFGVGTLPMLLMMGVLAEQLEKFKRVVWLKVVAGLTLSVIGALMVLDVMPIHIHHGM